MATNAEREGLGEDDVFHHLQIGGAAQDRQHDSRSVLLHLDRRREDFDRTGVEQFLFCVADDFWRDVIQIRFELHDLIRFRHRRALTDEQPQQVGAIGKVATAGSVADRFDGHLRQGRVSRDESFQNRRAYFQERQVESLDQHSREFIGLRIMVEIARRFLLGEKPVTGAALSELLGVPTGLAGKLLQALVSARLLAENQQSEAAYLPARPLEKITCHDVLHALRSNQNGSVSTRDDTMREQVRDHSERFQEGQKAAASNVTLAALAAEAAASANPTE